MQASPVFPGRVPDVDASHATDSRDVSLTIPARPDYLVLARLALSAVCRLTPLSPEEVADLKRAITEAAKDFVDESRGLEARHPRQVVVLGLADRQAVDVEPAGVQHPGDGGEHPGLVLDQGRQDVTHRRTGPL